MKKYMHIAIILILLISLFGGCAPKAGNATDDGKSSKTTEDTKSENKTDDAKNDKTADSKNENKNDDAKGNEESNTEIQITNDIVFICSMKRHGFGFVNRGYFIDKNGNKGVYDLSKESKDYADIDKLYDYLSKNYSKIETTPYLDKDVITKSYQYLTEVDPKAKFSEKSVMVDYGSCIIYGITESKEGSPIITMLEEYGDWSRISEDANIKKIIELMPDWMKI